MSEKQWIPLEANPEVLTKFGHKLGLPPSLEFCDVFSLDLLDMVPADRYAVILLFPMTEKIVRAASESSADVQTPGENAPFFCKQTIGNACGTIALLHAALNVYVPSDPLTPGSFFEAFEARTRNMTPTERAMALQDDQVLDSVHSQFAQEGQTAAPAANEKVDMHFVCFVVHRDVLYELDGRKDGPIPRGPSSDKTLLEDAGKVIKEKYMALDPEEHRFSIMALTLNWEVYCPHRIHY